MANKPIPCPVCGSPMNHHADKLIYQRETAAQAQGMDEVIEEFHRCPTCGAGASRTASLPADNRL